MTPVEAAGQENRRRLGAFLESALLRSQEAADPAGLLRANAGVLRRHLNALAADEPTPQHLAGLSAFDLADAAEALEAAAAAAGARQA